MKYTGKLELLKASMYELIELLREVDQISIVTYSSQAKVLLETISTSKKDTIKKVIEKIQAKGLTAGGRGLKMAYKNAHKNYIENGNNQVIIATDGDFNEGEENIKRLARKYKRKGITLSVIGIKNTPFIKIIMKDLAKKGGGNYIPVNSYDDALQSLVNEIKENSYIPFNK
jgi:Ca-activated chloride channel family protein